MKLLQRTRTDNEPEAIAAIRAANRLLDASGVNWTGLLPGSGVKVKTGDRAPSFVYDVPQVSIREAIEILESNSNLAEDLVDILEIYRGTGMMTATEKSLVYRAVAGILKDRGDV